MGGVRSFRRFAGRAGPCASRGLTLLEMMLVVTIAGVLLAFAVPSFKRVTSANRIAAEINGLLGDLQFARSEAIKEGQTVRVCVSQDGATCSTSATAWQNGWIVFSDVNNSGTVDSGDPVLRVQSTLTSSDALIEKNSIAVVTFNREGFAVGLPNGGALITLHASPVDKASTRCLSISLVGVMATMLYDGVTCT